MLSLQQILFVSIEPDGDYKVVTKVRYIWPPSGFEHWNTGFKALVSVYAMLLDTNECFLRCLHMTFVMLFFSDYCNIYV